MNQLIISVLVLAATAMQTIEALWQLRSHEALPAFTAVDDLHIEVPRWRLRARRRHRGVVKQLMRESPVEARAYRRIRRVFWSWGILAGAALYSVGSSLVELF